MCIRLSDFLRSTLSLGTREIAFSEELALARTYLGVEQIRFGARSGGSRRWTPGAALARFRRCCCSR